MVIFILFCVKIQYIYFFSSLGCVDMRYISQEEGVKINITYGDSLLHGAQVKGKRITKMFSLELNFINGFFLYITD